jgi:hypothetical protein
MPCTTQIFNGTTRRLPGGRETSPFSGLAAGPDVQYPNLVLKPNNANIFSYVTKCARTGCKEEILYKLLMSIADKNIALTVGTKDHITRN